MSSSAYLFMTHSHERAGDEKNGCLFGCIGVLITIVIALIILEVILPFLM